MTRTNVTAPPLRAARAFMPAKLAPSARAPGRCRSAAEPDARVFVAAVDADLEVEMRACRPAGRALEGDCRTARHDHSRAQARRVAGQVTVVGRVAVAMQNHEQVSVAHAARVQVSDTRVRGDDVRAVWPGDVDSGVDLVRPGTAGVVDLQIERRASKTLGDARVAAGRHGPLEDAVSAARLLRRGRVLLRELGDLGVDRRPLLLDLVVLGFQLDLQLLL